LKDLRECIVNELVYSEPQCNSLRAFFSLTAHPKNFVKTFFAKKMKEKCDTWWPFYKTFFFFCANQGDHMIRKNWHNFLKSSQISGQTK
jgi:hypothetical protein